jgi:hypothetical protein
LERAGRSRSSTWGDPAGKREARPLVERTRCSFQCRKGAESGRQGSPSGPTRPQLPLFTCTLADVRPGACAPPARRAHLAQAQERAEREQEEAKERFRSWATAAVPDAELMNVNSGPQVSQLLFAGCANKSLDKEGVPLERVFKVRRACLFPVWSGRRGGLSCFQGRVLLSRVQRGVLLSRVQGRALLSREGISGTRGGVCAARMVDRVWWVPGGGRASFCASMQHGSRVVSCMVGWPCLEGWEAGMRCSQSPLTISMQGCLSNPSHVAAQLLL